MSDARLREAERALERCPCVPCLRALDRERRRVGDGPWLPAWLPAVRPPSINTHVRWDPDVPHEFVSEGWIAGWSVSAPIFADDHPRDAPPNASRPHSIHAHGTTQGANGTLVINGVEHTALILDPCPPPAS